MPHNVTQFALIVCAISVVIIGSHDVNPPDFIMGMELAVFLMALAVSVVGMAIEFYRWVK